MIHTLKRAGFALIGVFIACVAYAQFSPAPPDIHINGHTYTASQWQASPLYTLAAIANDVNAITQLYPTGRFSPRVMLTADLAMYVDPGGSNSNTCLIGHPCQTIQYVYDTLRNGYDLAGYKVTVNLACGSYTSAGLYASSQLIGQTTASQLSFVGCNFGVPSATTISGTQAVSGDVASVMEASYSASFEVESLTITGTGEGLYAFRGGIIEYGNIVFGDTSGCHTTANQGGQIYTTAHNHIAGGGLAHYCAYVGGINGGCSSLTTCSVTNGSGVTFTGGGFAYAHNLGIVFAPNITFSGTSITASRYYVDGNGVIETGGGGASYFPGNTAGCGGGTCPSGGQYK